MMYPMAFVYEQLGVYFLPFIKLHPYSYLYPLLP